MDIMVIYKDLEELLQPFKENGCHCPRKSNSCILKPKWHHKPFIQSCFSDECCFLHIIKVHSNMLEPILKI
jgi:hypothetical protein